MTPGAAGPLSPRKLASGKLILDHPAEAVARLTLSNAKRLNALDHEVLDALGKVLPELDREIEIRCVMLTGAGETFCAGYEIVDIPEESFEHDAEALVAHPYHSAMEAVSAHPWPVVAVIDGPCLGGGLELAVRCDLRLVAERAKFGMPPAKLGLIYGHTGLERFIEVIGVARTKELFLTGRNMGAERAEGIGLVNQVVPDAELEAVALALASEMAANAPLAVRGNKRAIEALARFPPLTPAQEQELVDLRRSCFASEDFREGIRAFAEKRKPRWNGR